ncbi:MAG: O-antigen ligase family protein [Candidatus Blackburnbacteria bacterium]|nr:O-antigen ligase family protein [Candidatus Blackburnbacteria bacterium]
MLGLLFFYFILFPFGQLLSLQVLPSARIHAVDIAASFLVFYWLLQTARNRKTHRPLLATPVLAFLGVAVFSLVLGSIGKPFASVAVGVSYLVRLGLYTLLYFAVADFVIKARNMGKIKAIIYDSFIVCGMFFAILGLLGYLIYPDARALSEFGWDNHYYRLIGPLLDPAFTGILLVLFLILVTLRRWSGRKEQAFGVILFFLGWIALSLTYSRASYAGALAFFAAAFIARRNFKILAGGALLFVATLLLLPHPEASAGTNLARTQTISSRFSNYEEALQVGLKSPVFGVGYNLYSLALQGALQGRTLQGWEGKITHNGSGVHSSFLFVFATTGIAGLIVYSYLWFKILVLGWNRRRTVVGLALFCSTAALLVESVFDNSLFYPWVMGWMGILLAAQE